MSLDPLISLMIVSKPKIVNTLRITFAYCLVVSLLTLLPRQAGSVVIEQVPSESLNSSKETLDQKHRIERFCGDCHALPSPSSFEKHVWREEAIKGFEFYARSGRQDLSPPTLAETISYFEQRAPEKMMFPSWGSVDSNWSARFATEAIDWSKQHVPIGTASLTWLQFNEPDSRQLLACDARDGSVRMLQLHPNKCSHETALYLQNPARMLLSDLNGDGQKDMAVADLGSFMPFDHALGRLIALRRSKDSSDLVPSVILQGVGRIADVAVGNFTGDRLPSLIVAEFGHRETGGLHILENDSRPDSLQFKSRKIDNRPGTVRVIANDWDQDGREDFAALISQESECIEIFLSRDGRFENRMIWSANDLSFGCVSMEMTDLDQDGDRDLLFCNGDSFDNSKANASHGVQWLENLGALKFQFHRILDLPGAYGAKAGDFDSDGDLDIVAVANLPEKVEPSQLRDSKSPAIVILEQVSKAKFVPRILSQISPNHSCVEVADFNQDGKLDFAVGSIVFNQRTPPHGPGVTIWWQR
jgi:hypothetical protein